MFRHGWKDATATVIAEEHYESTGQGTAGQPSRSKMVLEVHPVSGEPFRSEVNINILGFSGELRHLIPPRVGEVLPVSYDPKSHKVHVKLDAAHDRRLVDRKSSDMLEEALHAPAGSGIPGVGAADSVEAQLAAAGVDLSSLTAAGIDPATLAGATVTTGDRTTQIGGTPPAEEQRPIISAAQVLATGIPATASLLGTYAAPPVATKPGTTLMGLSLLVQLPGQAAYETGAGYAVPIDKVGRLVPNVQLPVKVSRENQVIVAVDWNAF